MLVGLGGIVVSGLAIGQRLAGSNLAEDDEFLLAMEIRSTTSFGVEVKQPVPNCKILRHVKDEKK
jgi:hypothetical protein